jgi:hypothetical protein
VVATSIALDRRVTYYAEHLSDNIAVTPEGYLICRNAVIGRSGFQKYRVAEIADPEGLLGERYRPDEELELWRAPSEVFSPAALASFEGKTFTLSHPEELLDPDTERQNFVGHLQNVRRGTEPLDSGDWPLLADVVIKVREAIDAVNAGERELSCGYTYKLAREGYRWDQRNILGNHVALVPKGRAGAEARINDAALPEKESTVNLKSIFAGWAKTAKQEDIESALADKDVASVLTGVRSIATDAALKDDKKPGEGAADFVCIGKTADNVRIFALKTERAAAHDDDDDDDDDDKKKHGKDDGKEEENRAGMDRRKRMHDMVDRMLADESEEEEAKKAEDDADLGKLKELLGKHLEEEKREPEHKGDAADDDKHPEGCRCDDCKKGKDAEKEEGKKAEGEDSDVVRPEPVLEHANLQKNAFDAAMTMDILKAFRPIVAKSNDKKVKAAFDTMYDGFRKALKSVSDDGKNGSYMAFRTAASTANDEAKESKEHVAGTDGAWKPTESPLEKQQKENDALYASAGKRLREKSAPAARK